MKLLLKKCLVFSVLFIVLSLYSSRLFSLPGGILVNYVTVNGAGLKNGSSWANANDATQLQQVITETAAEEIWIAKGTYYPTADGDQTISFQLKSGLKIYGGFAGTEISLSQRNCLTNLTILSGDIGTAGDNYDNSYHVLFNSGINNTAILDGFTIQGGNADVAGGGIFNTNSSPVISNCVISNNATLSNGNGAGIYNESLSSPTLINCMIISNSTDGLGGGMFNYESSPTLINCDILKNSAGWGGGFYNDASSNTTINNSIIWSNTATSDGNQIYQADGAFTLNYSCYSNSTTGIADVTVGGGTLSDTNYNLTTNPKFANFVSDYRLTASSPCVDSGLDSYNTETTEIRGNGYSRKLNKSTGLTGTIDMGAYEYKAGSDPLVAEIPKLYVKADATGADNGTSWTNAYKSLQSALAEAYSGYQIWVAKGTYLPSADNDPTISFQLKSGVAVYGGFAGTESSLSSRNWNTNTVILSGDLGTTGDNSDNSDHVIFNSNVDNSAILDGFTITGGNASGAGGGIFNSASSPFITNCIIANNAVQASGTGAGVYNEASSSPTFTNCVFSNNITEGGMGGGIFSTQSSPLLINCTLTRNSASFGGAIFNDYAATTAIKNSIVWGNSATTDGNQIYANDGTTSINYSCFANATAPSGISDVAGGATIDSMSVGHNIHSNPRFVNLFYSFNLSGSSPCLDGGQDGYNTENTDIRGSGYSRKLNKSTGSAGTIDMGAYEFKVGTDPTVPDVPKFFVKGDATGANNGSSWTDAYTSLQSALAASISGVQIWVARGTYIPTTDYAPDSAFRMKSGVAIYGGFAGNEAYVSSRNWLTNNTILSGYIGLPADSTVRSYHVIFNSDVDGTAILDGFTIQGGNADYAGGGIYNTGTAIGASPTISNCIITDNTTASGGNGAGIYNEASSSPTLTNCIISYNTTDGNGGGIYNLNSSPKLINCTLAQNKAGLGGGIYNETGSSPMIYNSIIWGNFFFVSGNGAGRQMYLNGGSVTLFNSCYKNATSDISGSVAPTVDATDITTDPKFADATIGDFRIGGNSPCLDLGNDAYNSESTDIRGPGYSRKRLKTNANLVGTIDMGAYEFQYLVDPDCAPIPQAKVVADQAVCLGSGITIGGRAAVTGNTYSWTSSPAGFTSTSANPTVTPSLTTTYTLTEKITATGCQNSHHVTITVTPGATITSASSATWCNAVSNSYTPTCSISTATFTWTRAAVTGISNAAITNGSGTVITETLINTTLNPVNVVYKITPVVSGCSNSTPMDVTITINPTAVITSSATANYCSNATNIYTATTSTTSGILTYDWKRATVPGISNAAVTNGTGPIITEMLTNTTANPIVVHYLITLSVNGCAGTTKDVSVTVNPTPMISSASSAIWSNAISHTYTPTTTTTSGTITYIWTRSAVAGISNAAVTNGTGPNITETLENTTTDPVVVHYVIVPIVNGCTGLSKDFAVTVNPNDPPVLNGIASVCANATGTVYSTPVKTGHSYSWTISGGTITAGASTSSITVNWGTQGSGWVKVYDTTIATDRVNTNILNVTINPLPAAAAGADRTICANTITQIGATAVNGSTYSWTSLPAGFTSTLANPSISTSSTVTYKVIETNNNVCINTHNVVVTIPVPTITGLSTVCESTTGNVYTTETGMTAYVWTVSAGGTITSGGTAADRTVTIKWNTPGSQSVKVNYTTPGGCIALSPAVINVNVNALPSPSISGVLASCIGSKGVIYTTDAAMTGYIWNISTGGTITSGAGTNQIAVSWNTVGTQTIGVNYVNANGCTALSSAVKNLTVNPLIGTTGAITGTASLCGGAQSVYSVTPVANATTYVWTLPAGATIASGSGTSSVTVNYSAMASSGNVSVYAGNFCGNSNTSLLAIQVTPLADVAGIINGPSSACQGSTGLIFSVPKIVNATSYTWSLPAGATLISGTNTNSIVVDLSKAAITGPLTVYGSNSCGKGAVSPVFTLTVNPIPPKPVISPSGTNITSNAPAGNQWYYSSNVDGVGAAIPGATAQAYTPTQNGWYWTVCTLINCSSTASNHLYRLKAGEANRYNLYPVPNDGEFTVAITTPDEQKFSILVYDQLGKKMYEHTDFVINGDFRQVINLRPSPTGIYTIVFQTKDGNVVRRFTIHK